MEIEFEKYQGTGNDFVIINNLGHTFPSENFDLIAKICQRRFGIGADGLILIEKENDIFKMVYFNADGRQSSMCGNGGRCFAKYIFDHQLVTENKLEFIAIDGMHQAFSKAESIQLAMIPVDGITRHMENWVLDTGSPHLVCFNNTVNDSDFVEKARTIRQSPPFASNGINVNFAEILSNSSISARTYERGVEDETFSCGTGVTAIALAAHRAGKINESPVVINTKGGELRVHFKFSDKQYHDIWLEGPAKFVYKGTLNSNDFLSLIE